MKNLLLALILLVLVAPSISAKRQTFPPKDDPNKRNEWFQSTFINPESQQDIPANIDELQRNFSRTLPVANVGLRTKGSQIQSQTWIPAGPSNIGGRTRAVAYDINNPNIMIAGGVSGGIWRSVDGGQSWVQTSGKNEVASVTAIVQDTRPGKTNIWYYGGGELLGNSAGTSKNVSYYGTGIHKSTDNGLTWKILESTDINSPIPNRGAFDNVMRLVIDHTNMDKDIIYAACHGAIYRSENGGESWEGVLGNPSEPSRGSRHIDLIINDDGTLYAALSQYQYNQYYDANQFGFFRSTDGQDWEDITPDNYYNQTIRTVIGTTGGDDGIVYFLSAHNQVNGADCHPGSYSCHSLFALEYAGSPYWSNLTENLPNIQGKYRDGTYASQSGYDMCIAVSPDDEEIVIIGGSSLFMSESGFYTKNSTSWIGGYSPDYYPTSESGTWLDRIASWRSMMFPTGGWDYHTIVFNPANPNEFLTGSDHGIHRLSNLEDAIDEGIYSFDDLNNGYNTTQFYDCSIHPTEPGNETIVGGMQDNGTWATFSSDVKFFEMTGGDGMHSTISPNGDILVSSQYGNIMRLIYNGTEMVDGYEFQPFETLETNFGFYTPFEINPNDTKGVAMGGIGALTYCTDFTNKQLAKNNWHKIEFDQQYISSTALAFAESQNDLLYVGTNYAGIYKINDVSTPLSTKSIIRYPSDVSYVYTSDLWVNPVDEMNIIAIISNYYSRSILETTDGGDNWIDHGGNLEENEDGSGNGPSVRTYARLNYKGETVHFVGTSTGLYSTKSLDGTNTVWVREGENTIGMAVVSQIHTRNSDGKIVVSTHGNGIFKTNYSTSIDDFNGHNLGFIASEVYPNPASSEINFVLNTDDNAFVEAKLLDLQGNVISTLISEKFSGTRKVNFDASYLAPGTYFINISDGNHYVTKKVNVVR